MCTYVAVILPTGFNVYICCGNTLLSVVCTYYVTVIVPAGYNNVYTLLPCTQAVTFQIVLVTDSTRTYVLLLYSDVRWDRSNGHGVLVGFNAGLRPEHTQHISFGCDKPSYSLHGAGVLLHGKILCEVDFGCM